MTDKNKVARLRKLERIAEGGSLRCLDLFSGCGGLSLGFHTAGAVIVGAIECDPIAAATHAANFHGSEPESTRRRYAKDRNIQSTCPSSLVRSLHLGRATRECVDVLIGGPPCQAFARVGRAKLRDVMEHPDAFKQDPRANLYLRFLQYVDSFQPLAILVENVPDSLNYGGHNIAAEMCEALSAKGYTCSYTLLNAAFYGVPQMRERMFLLAYAPELTSPPRFPDPTHYVKLPPGYKGSRDVALKSLKSFQQSLFRDPFYVDTPNASSELTKAVTAKEALGDLPPIRLHLNGGLRRGVRRFDQIVCYTENHTLSAYATLMREWPGFESGEGVSDHVIRSLPRDYRIFAEMAPGDQYPDAHKLAKRLFDDELCRRELSGTPVARNSKAFKELEKLFVPPYDPGKFPNKWRKMERDQPARTLMAHLGKDSYSHIHYDSEQARTISVREAARLQSFPDGFVFKGAMNSAFRQIGNAVPPLMAYALACVILAAFRVTPQVLPQTWLNTLSADLAVATAAPNA